MAQLDGISRTVLPIPRRPHVGVTTYDAKSPDTSFPPIERLRPPENAPHVLVILLDDVGFGSSSAFGGPCRTPTAERLAANGLRYNRFHTTALCSPTRQALLTGRNHHAVGMGGLTELATSAPGYSSVRPDTAAPLAEILKLNGYSTAQFGKCHEVPVWEMSPMGPFRQWPTDSGFEYFYGFVSGEANQWYPVLYEGTTPIEPPRTPEQGYHFTEDMTDRAIGWIRQQRSLVPDSPFFVYFAPGATHAPHHVPTEWANRYRGRFGAGWDAVRAETFAHQKHLGVIPADADLTERPADIPPWDDVADDLKPVLARQMEVYAGFLEHTDHHIGRLITALDEVGVLADTLIYYIIGDNGASAEAGLNGSLNESLIFNLRAHLETAEMMAARIDEFGTPTAYNHFSVGWAHAMSCPYQWTKQVASHWGGTRNGTIVHWPRGFRAAGEVRSQFFHVIDVAATVLDAADLPEPHFVHGIQQMPLHGISMVSTFDHGAAPERRETQYFEMFCNRGIYHKGWTAVTRHSHPWIHGPMPALDDDQWELYDTNVDWTQAHDLAGVRPDKLRELQQLFIIEATKHNVFPLDDRRGERFDPALAGRPQLVRGTSQVLYGDMGRLSEYSVISLKNRSHAVTAQIAVPDGGATGVIIAQGGAFAGWSLYVHDGMLTYCHNHLALARFKVAATTPLPAGKHQVRMDFAYDGGGLGKGGTVTLFVDANEVGTGRVDATVPVLYSGNETCNVGCDTGTPVSDDYTAETSTFNGAIDWVQLDTSSDDHDRLIAPEQRLRVAMARQ